MEQKVMTLRLASDTAKELETVAQVEEISVTEAVRAAIEAYIRERRGDESFKQRLRRTIEENQEILQRLAD